MIHKVPLLCYPSPFVCCCVASSSSPHVWVAPLPCVCVVLLHHCHCLVYVLHHHLVSMLPHHLVYTPSLCVYIASHLACALHHHFVSMPLPCVLLCHHLMFTLHRCPMFVPLPCVCVAPSPYVYIASSLCVRAIATNLCLCYHLVTMLYHCHRLMFVLHPHLQKIIWKFIYLMPSHLYFTPLSIIVV